MQCYLSTKKLTLFNSYLQTNIIHGIDDLDLLPSLKMELFNKCDFIFVSSNVENHICHYLYDNYFKIKGKDFPLLKKFCDKYGYLINENNINIQKKAIYLYHINYSSSTFFFCGQVNWYNVPYNAKSLQDLLNFFRLIDDDINDQMIKLKEKKYFFNFLRP